MSDTNEKTGVVEVEEPVGVMEVNDRVKNFEEQQHSLSIKEAMVQEWKPLAWCIYMFFICITWGYDGMAGTVVVSIAQFREQFGYPYESDYVVSAKWQLSWSAAIIVGLIVGATATGFAVTRIGRQYTLAIAYLISIAGVFVEFFATDPAMFFGGKLLVSIPMGAYTSLAPAYAAEMSPLVIRGAIIASSNLAIVLGQLLAYCVILGTTNYEGKAGYQILFAGQWIFVGIALILLPFLPESPYWLIANGQDDKARAVIKKLHAPDYDVDGAFEQVQSAVTKDNDTGASQGTMMDCFARSELKRTLVSVCMFAIQTSSGSPWVLGYISYFMQLNGVDSDTSFRATVGITGSQVIGNLLGWYNVERFGRRGTTLYGTAALFVALLVIGIVSVIPDNPSAIWVQVGFMGVWSFIYQATIGSSAWPISSENPNSRLRSPTQALAAVTNGLGSCLWTFVLPYLVNPDEADLGGKIAFIFSGMMLLVIVFIYYMIPETKGRTYAEVDYLWKSGIPIRKWAKTQVVLVSDGRHSNDSKEE
ncbi:maltose permease [Ophiostoma piceae UAMH 11346]|uniref:Maltose permease n=1 Tax=Ophiostoma piceae (strain UAMH 11346) TaxID=1262450 RepID=S3CAC2_OPHP1|nr:maltose permease [Ophiostoma piceae UAMH 11346]